MTIYKKNTKTPTNHLKLPYFVFSGGTAGAQDGEVWEVAGFSLSRLFCLALPPCLQAA